MPTKLLKNQTGWRHNALIPVLICLSFSPYLFFVFGFHNDFEIWAYNNSICCSGFPETNHLIRIGRFLQAFLQNVYLSFFTDLRSLVFGRALGIAFACIGAIMLSLIARKNGMGKLASAAFGAAVFLLPPAQVNLGWITNFVPGLFNAVLVLYAASIFPEWQSILTRERMARVRLGVCFLLLLAALFIYPPTIGFFLLPVMIRIMYSGFAKREDRLQATYALVFFGLACLVYFFMHRVVYMKLFAITFPADAFYRFDISTGLLGNLIKFFHEIFPVMLNLWNPAPSPIIAASVLFLIIAPAAFGVYRNCRSFTSSEVLTRSAIITAFWLVLFLAMNSPGLLAIGQPPTFYRAWHPGMAAVLLLLFHSIEFFRMAVIKNAILFAFLLAGCIFSFNSSMHLATTLSKQFEYAVAQISAQFSPDRERYVIVEKRPSSLLLGRTRWGELGFVHILTPGHGIYILKKYFDFGVHPIIESVVVKQDENSLLLEPELLGKKSSNPFFPRSPADLLNKPFDKAFDLRVDTFFEKSGPMPAIIDIVGTKPARVACYKIHAGESPARAPRSWRFTGSNDRHTWAVLDSQSNLPPWREGEGQLFTPAQTGNYKHYRLEVDSANQDGIIRVSEMQLFTRASACQEPDSLQESMVDASLLKSLTSMPNAMPVRLVGTVKESGLSAPPFRLQRAFDNIYYTFWETPGIFPINVDFNFFESKQIKCYAFQAGIDRANDRMPRAWKFLGSNDGRNWNLLDTRDDESAWTDNSRRIYPVSSSAPYRSYRMEFLSVNNGGILRIYEIALSEDRDCIHTIP